MENAVNDKAAVPLPPPPPLGYTVGAEKASFEKKKYQRTPLAPAVSIQKESGFIVSFILFCAMPDHSIPLRFFLPG